jgi:hypothetical protein
MPAPDDLDRERFYTADAADNSDEYELEAPDPEVLTAEQRRADEVMVATRRSIDIDEIYRQADHSHSSEIVENWVRNFRFRFQVKHLFIATAVVAILLTLWRLDWLGNALILLVMATIIGTFLYLQWKDKQYQDAAAQRRRKLYEERRDAHANPARAVDVPPSRKTTSATLLPANDVDAAWQQAMEQQRIRFQFSLKQLLLVMMSAAIVMGLVQFFGGPGETAAVLGMIALLGLVLHAIGFEPPPMVAIGWWLLLLMYVVLCFGGVLWSAMQ